MEPTGSIVRSSIARTSLTLIGMLVAFFMMPFLVSRLGDHSYGLWTLLQSFTGYYYMLDFGLATAVSRFVSFHLSRHDSVNANVIINTSLALYTLLACLIALTTFLLLPILGNFAQDSAHRSTVQLAFLLLGLNLALEFPFKALTGVAGAYLRYDLLTYSHFASLMIGVTLIWLFLSRGFGLLALAAITVACSQISNILFFLIARYLFPDLHFSPRYFDRRKIRELYSYSLWSFILQLGDQLRFRLDSFVIAWRLSASAVTHFSVGANVAQYFLNLIYRATNILTPLFTRYFAQGASDTFRSTLILATKINTALAIFGGGLILITGRHLIATWMGPAYLDAYPVAATLVAAMALEAIQNPLNNAVMAISRHRFYAIVTLLEGIANLALSLLLLPSLGILGVALGTLIPLILTRLIIMPAYATRCCDVTLKVFYAAIGRTAGPILLYLYGVNMASSYFLEHRAYAGIILLSASATPGFLMLLWLFAFVSTEKLLIRSVVPHRIVTWVGSR